MKDTTAIDAAKIDEALKSLDQLTEAEQLGKSLHDAQTNYAMAAAQLLNAYYAWEIAQVQAGLLSFRSPERRLPKFERSIALPEAGDRFVAVAINGDYIQTHVSL